MTSLVPGDGTYSFVLAGTSSDGVDFSSREATNKPQLVVTTAASNDVTNPSDPTGLGAVAISSGRVDLSWTASTDNVGVTGYEIFRNGTLVTSVGAVTTFADTTAAPSTAYTYQVRAFDAAGNRGQSASASTTTPSARPRPRRRRAVGRRLRCRGHVLDDLRHVNHSRGRRRGSDVESCIRVPVSGLTARSRVPGCGCGSAPTRPATARCLHDESAWRRAPSRGRTGRCASERAPDKGSIPTDSWVENNGALPDRRATERPTSCWQAPRRTASVSPLGGRYDKPQLVDVRRCETKENPSDRCCCRGRRLRDQGRPELDGLHRQHRRDGYGIFRNGTLRTTVGNVSPTPTRRWWTRRITTRSEPSTCGQSLRIQQTVSVTTPLDTANRRRRRRSSPPRRRRPGST